VHALAKSIAEDGYFPDERIVVIEQDGSTIVLEGNRRISALKVLMNPDLAPDEMKSKFQRLAEIVDRKLIAQFDALVAPRRNAATKLILEKHTQQSVLSWSPLMKAEFYRKMTEQGTSTNEIAKQYNLSVSTVHSFVRTSRIYRLALAVDLSPEVRELVSDPQRFPISTLERVYDNGDSRKALTITDDLSTISCPPSEFKKALSHIVSDIASGIHDSRTLDTANDIRDYTRKVAESVGIRDTGIPVKVDAILPQHQPTFPITPKTTPKPTRSSRQSKGLFGGTDMPFKLKGAMSLRRLYDELRVLPVKTYPNTAAILFRVFLDKAARHFLKRKGVRAVSVGRQTKKLADVTFGEILDFVCEKSNQLIADDNVKKAVRTFKSSSSFKSLSTLNSIVHNEELSFTETQARDLFPNVEGLLKILLSD
jgi:transposase-like protein